MQKLVKVEVPIYRWDFSFSYSKDTRQANTEYDDADSKIYIKFEDIMNSSSEIVILIPREAIGTLDLRSLGYYKIQYGVLQQNLSKFYNFKSAQNVCNQVNNLINTLKKEEKL